MKRDGWTILEEFDILYALKWLEQQEYHNIYSD